MIKQVTANFLLSSIYKDIKDIVRTPFAGREFDAMDAYQIAAFEYVLGTFPQEEIQEMLGDGNI